MPTYSRRDSERLGRPPRIKKQSCSSAMLSSVQAIVKRHSFRPISELRGSTPCVCPRLGIQCCHIEPRGSAMQWHPRLDHLRCPVCLLPSQASRHCTLAPRPAFSHFVTIPSRSGLEALSHVHILAPHPIVLSVMSRASRLCDLIAYSPRDHHIMHKCKLTHTSASCPEPRGSAIRSHPRLGSHHLCTSVLHTHQCIAVNP